MLTVEELLKQSRQKTLKRAGGRKMPKNLAKFKAFCSMSLLAQERDAAQELLPLAREFVRRTKHLYYHYKPANHPRRNQVAFHCSDAVIRLVKGGNRSGKSHGTAMDVSMAVRGEHPVIPEPEKDQLFWIVSAKYRTLQNGIWKHLKKMLPPWDIVRYGPNVPNYDMPSFLVYRHKHSVTGVYYHHTIEFLSSSGGEQARERMTSAPVDYICVDEEIDWRTWDELRARIIDTGGRIAISATLYRSDPWLLDLEEFALSDPDIDCFTLNTEQALEDGHIHERQFKQLVKGMTKEEYAVRILGESRRAYGRVYSNLTEKNIMADDFIPKDWRRYCAIDPGHSTAAVLYIAALPTGHYWVYREIYLQKSDWKELAVAMRQAEGWVWDEQRELWKPGPNYESIYVRLIDPAGFAHTMTGEQGAGDLLNVHYGFDCVPARNDVEYGISLCRRDLENEINGKPVCRIFESCLYFQRELSRYKRAVDTADARKHERRAVPIRRDNHLMDDWRYIKIYGIEPSVDSSGMPAEEVQRVGGLLGASGGPLTTEGNAIAAARKAIFKPGDERQAVHSQGLGDQY